MLSFVILDEMRFQRTACMLQAEHPEQSLSLQSQILILNPISFNGLIMEVMVVKELDSELSEL